MYAGVVQIPVTTYPDFVDGVRAATQRFYPLLAEQPGFAGVLVLMEREARTAIGIGLWDTPGHAADAVRATDAVTGFEESAGIPFEQGLSQWLVVHCQVDATPSFADAPIDPAAPARLARCARIVHVTGRVGPKFVEESRQTLALLLPFTQELPGYRGGLGLVDERTGSGLTISLWATDDDMRRAAERARGAATAGAIALETDPAATTIESWEVVLLDVRAVVSLEEPPAP